MNKRDVFKRLFDAARAIIFDFDGVLADSEKWHFETYSEVFARHGHTIDETEYYKYWTSLGLGARGEIERYGLDLDPVAIRDEKRPLFSERCRDGSIELYPQAHEILDRAADSWSGLGHDHHFLPLEWFSFGWGFLYGFFRGFPLWSRCRGRCRHDTSRCDEHHDDRNRQQAQ